MKRHWQVRRQTAPHPDGQRRWDRAYQLLLQWEQARLMALTPEREQISEPPQEGSHERASSHLRPGIHT
jgi:hypothetical protein